MLDESLTEDMLFLACTRPAMLLGVPLEAMSVNMMLTGLIFLAGGTPLYLLSGVVLHVLFRAIVKNDHNAFRVLFIWFDTKARARNAGCSWLDDRIRKRPWGEKSFYLRDPFGNPLCFVDENTAFTGRDTDAPREG